MYDLSAASITKIKTYTTVNDYKKTNANANKTKIIAHRTINNNKIAILIRFSTM